MRAEHVTDALAFDGDFSAAGFRELRSDAQP
jgi:predicted nucleic acid-binding protein